jgi:uncharacterized protein (TIGR02996 family)
MTTHTPPAFMSHPEFAPLRANVVANKEDDLPRLVLADWLDESDRSPLWADLIRVQCELARSPTDGLDSKESKLLTNAELLDQFRTLLDQFRTVGQDTCPSTPNPFFLTTSEQVIREGRHHNREAPWGLIRRGFVEQVRCTPEWWAINSNKTCQEWPVTDVWWSRRYVELAPDNAQVGLPDDLTEFDDRGVKVHLPPAVVGTPRMVPVIEAVRELRDRLTSARDPGDLVARTVEQIQRRAQETVDAEFRRIYPHLRPESVRIHPHPIPKRPVVRVRCCTTENGNLYTIVDLNRRVVTVGLRVGNQHVQDCDYAWWHGICSECRTVHLIPMTPSSRTVRPLNWEGR